MKRDFCLTPMVGYGMSLVVHACNSKRATVLSSFYTLAACFHYQRHAICLNNPLSFSYTDALFESF